EGRRFYREQLGFEEIAVDFDGCWSTLQHGEMEIGLAQGEPSEDGVAHVEVADLKHEAERLREAGVEVGIVLELTGEMRLLDVYGAAWYRLFPESAPGFASVDEETPELTVAVVPSHRGHGTGGELLEALLAQARADGFSSISLSAEPGQTQFYEKHGFRELRR